MYLFILLFVLFHAEVIPPVLSFLKIQVLALSRNTFQSLSSVFISPFSLATRKLHQLVQWPSASNCDAAGTLILSFLESPLEHLKGEKYQGGGGGQGGLVNQIKNKSPALTDRWSIYFVRKYKRFISVNASARILFTFGFLLLLFTGYIV